MRGKNYLNSGMRWFTKLLIKTELWSNKVKKWLRLKIKLIKMQIK